MGLLGALKKGLVSITKGAIKLVETTCEVCEEAFHRGREKCKEVREKIDNWVKDLKDKKDKTTDPVPPEIKDYYKPKIEEAKRNITSRVPSGIETVCNETTPEERKDIILGVANDAIKILGIKNQPDIVAKYPEDEASLWTSYGSYNFKENRLELNLAMIVTEEPSLFQEQISTVFHELIHARQFMAIEAWCQGKSVDEYGYSEEYVKLLAYNIQNYISPKENFEAYTKQPLEAEAYWFEQQLGLTHLNK